MRENPVKERVVVDRVQWKKKTHVIEIELRSYLNRSPRHGANIFFVAI